MKPFYLLTVISTLLLTISAYAQQPEVFQKKGYAIDGYDVVSYFTENKPVKGDSSLVIEWKNAKWLFSSSNNLELFKKDPEKYAPQYGGYCAYGCSRGYKAPTMFDAYSIVNGKLYFNYNTDVRVIWNKDQENFIKKADVNWATINKK